VFRNFYCDKEKTSQKEVFQTGGKKGSFPELGLNQNGNSRNWRSVMFVNKRVLPKNIKRLKTGGYGSENLPTMDQ